jgi:hypothetical protein
MLRIQIIGLALVSAIVMSAVAAGSASAETELKWQWLLFHSATEQHLLLSKPELVESEGLVLLTDHNFPASGATVHCRGFDLGTVGPHGLDLIKSITLELLGTKKSVLCLLTTAGGCKEGKMPTAEAINLPWHTQLILHGTQVRDLILGHGGGAPGWKVTCESAIGTATIEDTCEEEVGKPGSTLMKNEGLAGVLGEFKEAENPRAKCSVGGKEAGSVNGTVLTESPSTTLLILISPLD